jgi:hypothetical protein
MQRGTYRRQRAQVCSLLPVWCVTDQKWPPLSRQEQGEKEAVNSLVLYAECLVTKSFQLKISLDVDCKNLQE